MERLAIHGSSKGTKFPICNFMSKAVFEPAGAVLIKTKMQHFICKESEGIGRNSENS